MVAWVTGYLYPKAYRLLPTVVKRNSASVTEMDGWRFGGGPGARWPDSPATTWRSQAQALLFLVIDCSSGTLYRLGVVASTGTRNESRFIDLQLE
jgi:hypothetical protein